MKPELLRDEIGYYLEELITLEEFKRRLEEIGISSRDALLLLIALDTIMAWDK